MSSKPEVWLRGPIDGIVPLLQPVAHSLLQCREEVAAQVSPLTAEQVLARPGGAASIDYHVRHAAGSLDRLFTYARDEALSAEQLSALRAESETSRGEARHLVTLFETAVDRAMAQLRATDDAVLLQRRGVGRARLPSTVLGLLFHAAEHTQRHIGQMVTTSKVVLGLNPMGGGSGGQAR